MKLDEFRLKSYNERSVLGTALQLYRNHYPGDNEEAVNKLLMRLSQTECQPGGCPYCNADRAKEDGWWDE